MGKDDLIVVGAVAAVTVGGALLWILKSSGGQQGGPIPTGSTFLGVASLSGNDTLSVPFDINGTVQNVDIGAGGGATLDFDGVDPYSISVPATLGAATFQYFYLVGGPNSGQQVMSATLQVPGGAYTETGAQIIAWYS